MGKGSCICGDIQYEYEGEPYANSICHCQPCRKLAGPTGSGWTIVESAKFNITKGSEGLTPYTRTWTESGKEVHHKACSKCSTPMFVEADTVPGMTLIRTGTLDEPKEIPKPSFEIYTAHRPGWCAAIEEAAQVEGAPKHDL